MNISPHEAFARGRRKGFDIDFKFEEWDFASQRLIGDDESTAEVNNILDLPSAHFLTKWSLIGGRLFVADSRESLLEMLNSSNLDEFYGVPSFVMEGLGYVSDTNPRIKDNFTGNYFRISQEKLLKKFRNGCVKNMVKMAINGFWSTQRMTPSQSHSKNI